MIDWSPLHSALARCRSTNTAVPIWWRDDDAIAPTAALDQLSEMSEKVGVPVHLAVIPKPAETALVPYISDRPNLVPCVHGWTHQSTAPEGQKKSEFGVARATGAVEIQLAITRMTELFKDDLLPLFVPPWNRLDDSFLPNLVQSEYTGFSTFGPRPVSPLLLQINTHIDPIFWRGTRGLVDPEDLVKQSADILHARCDGYQDVQEPFGLLTHHLVHVPEVWEFSLAFISELMAGGGIPADLKDPQ